MTHKLLSTIALSAAVFGFTPPTTFAMDGFKEMPAGAYTLDDTHASLTWQVSHIGLSNYTARFTDIDAEIDYNPDDITKSVVTANINPASLKTDFPYPEKKDFDKKLIKGEDWFNASKFPHIKFKSTKIEMTGEKTAVMTGNLTFMGVTKPVSLNVVLNGAYKVQPFSQKPALGFSATGSITRSEFGMATYVPNIGDEVNLILEMEFEKK